MDAHRGYAGLLILEQGSSKDMKLYQILVIAILSTSVLYGSAAAEYQEDRVFGNGRFLRRLRGETKKPEPKSKSKDSKSSSSRNKQAESRGKSPTPASRRSKGKSPTPAVRQTGGRVPTPAKRSVAKSGTTSNTKAKKSSAKSKDSTGFGMQLVMKSEKLVVSKIDSRGNAREAGVKKGDVILEAGGAKIGSVEELAEISKILGEGDQLEFQTDRRGKENTVLIQYGTAPEVDEIVESAIKPKNDFSPTPQRDDKQTAASVIASRAPSEAVVGSGVQQTSAQKTIAQQRRQIEQMQQQIKQLKKQSTNLNSIIEIPKFENQDEATSSGGPNLSGPGN